MIVNAFALVTALFYTMNIPLTMSISLSEMGNIGISISVFGAKPVVNIDTSVSKLAESLFKKKSRKKPPLAKTVFKALRFRRVDIRLSTPDACHTALLCGAVICVLSAVGVKSFTVVPDFSRCETAFNAQCIVSTFVGKALFAAGNIAFGAIKERMNVGSARTD